MTHFLDEEGNISESNPKEARELASFLALVIDSYTSLFTDDEQEVRCFSKNCPGFISIGRSNITDEIIWGCPECGTDGTIKDWRGTVWDIKNTTRLENPEIEKQIIQRFNQLKAKLVFPIAVTPNDLIKDDFPDVDNWMLTGIIDCVEIYGLIVEIETGGKQFTIPLLK